MHIGTQGVYRELFDSDRNFKACELFDSPYLP